MSKRWFTGSTKSTAQDGISCPVTFLAASRRRGAWLGMLLAPCQLVMSLFCTSLTYPISILYTPIFLQIPCLINSLFTVCNVHCNCLQHSYFGNIFAATLKKSCSIASPWRCCCLQYLKNESKLKVDTVHCAYTETKRPNFVESSSNHKF